MLTISLPSYNAIFKSMPNMLIKSDAITIFPFLGEKRELDFA